jgi:cellobiose phosphorylase
MLKASFGYFDKDGAEFVVTDYKTPLPLINYFWNEQFISGVSQQMAGIGCFTDRPMQYMHPETRSLMVREENRHFYLRDDESGEFWSPGCYPVGVEPDKFLCRHGLGYSVLESETRGIETQMRVFVPEDEPAEIWTVTLANRSEKKRKVSFYSFIDLLLTGYEEYCDYHSHLLTSYDKSSRALTAVNRAPETPHAWFCAFVASDRDPDGYDGARGSFLGTPGAVSVPRAVVEGEMGNSEGVCERLVGAFQHKFELAPGESVSFNVAIGATDSPETSARISGKIFAPGAVEEMFVQMRDNLAAKYCTVKVNTPEERLNYLFNGWIKRSVHLHTEVGTDTGRGFRDVMQAAWGVSSYDPESARQKIIDSLKHQYAEGHTLRGWNPVDTHHYSDGPVWIAPAVDSYIKETGDHAFLDIKVPYFDEGEGTIWDHTLQSIRHSSDDTGEHGLVLMHYGDWNDSLNMIGNAGRGESVWTTIAMVFSINTALEIVRNVIKDEALEEELLQRAARLTEAVKKHGWDGDWYLEAFNDAGQPVGSHTEKQGRVYLNPQTWSLMAGIADDDRREKILKAIDEQLECDYGSMVCSPAYSIPNPGIGRITYFVPGMWENGAPYCHGSAFKIMADTYAGRGDIAYRSMIKVLPDNPDHPSTVSGCPPYMVTNMYYGPEHPRAGRILYSWVTGTAEWLFKSLTCNMIGVRAGYDGLLIDPCMPSHWKTAGLVRDFRGATYDVTVENPDGRETGVKSIELDGQKIEGNVLPIHSDGKTHTVKVVM